MKLLVRTALASLLLIAGYAHFAHAEGAGFGGQNHNTSAAISLGACSFNQGMGTVPFIGVHGDYTFSKWFGAGIFVDYASLGTTVPGMPGTVAQVNGNFYLAALELNVFGPSFLRGLSLGPSFGFSSFNSPATSTLGSYNSIYMTYGLHLDFDIPVYSGMSVGLLASDMFITSSSDLGFNTSEINVGAVIKFWLSDTSD